jgi:hypothetical protein
MHPVKALWDCHQPPGGYPDGVCEVPELISGRAFFPGGYGLWGTKRGSPPPEFPVGGIMVLGQDFDTKAGYKKSQESGGERDSMPTWHNLRKLLDSGGVAQERCFFTNLYMGLRSDKPNTGPFPGAKNKQFVEHCECFLRQQIRAQRPSLILTLGVHVPHAIGKLSPQLEKWAEGRGLKYIDKVGPLKEGVIFSEIEDFQTTVVALTHPSLYHANVRHRQYNGLVGKDAERALLRSGLEAAKSKGLPIRSSRTGSGGRARSSMPW